jgi:hypothetical protein
VSGLPLPLPLPPAGTEIQRVDIIVRICPGGVH